MWRHLVIVVTGSFGIGSQAYAPIQWMRFPAKRLVLAPKNLGRSPKVVTPPQKLIITAPHDGMAPHFTLKADKRITWDDMGWCIEAASASTGATVQVNRCTGGPTQRWNWQADANGRTMIQLDGTNKCVDVADRDGDFNGIQIELRECEDRVAKAWAFDAPISLQVRGSSQIFAPSLEVRHALAALIVLVGLAALSLSVWFWQRPTARTVFASRNGVPMINDAEGGVSVSEPERCVSFELDWSPIMYHNHNRRSSVRMALSAVTIPDSAPSWDVLTETVGQTAIGKSMGDALELRLKGKGPAHTDALLRLFDAESEKNVRVTLYRDDAAWCPYCQKVWLLLEEKQIPFKVSKINMRSYGDKPREFLRKVPGGLLPAIEIDGQLMTESLRIMQVLDAEFPSAPPMIPPQGTEEFEMANRLLRLERELFGKWCQLTFSPGKGHLNMGEKGFLDTLRQVDSALRATPGPWFLGGDAPSLVDLQYVSHVERMLASVLYWKGIKIRGKDEFKGLDTWLAAFEERPAYIATKSDYYTHVRDIPPQYGPGYSIDEAKDVAKVIEGGAWKLPVNPDNLNSVEPLAPLQWNGEEESRHEAAWKLANNHENVVKFAARGAGKRDGSFQAPLADPYATPSEDLIPAVDVALRHVVVALLDGTEKASVAATADFSVLKAKEDDSKRLASCIVYLRDRIGVPRDMGQAAAFQLRGTLNWVLSMI